MSTAILKILSLIFMTCDHLASFMPSVFPLYFKYIGRMAGPIFLFCFAQSLKHTKDRKKLLIRIYIISVITSIGNIILLLVLKNNDFIISNVFATFFVIGLIVYMFERPYKSIKNKVFALIILGVLQEIFIAICIAPFVSNIENAVNVNWTSSMLLAVTGFLPNFTTCESGMLWVALGILFYVFKNDRKKQCLVMAAYSLLLFVLFFVLGKFSISYMFTDGYEWMAVFSIPFMLAYNGKKGNISKYVFYIYYPVHIWILYLIGCML